MFPNVIQAWEEVCKNEAETINTDLRKVIPIHVFTKRQCNIGKVTGEQQDSFSEGKKDGPRVSYQCCVSEAVPLITNEPDDHDG